MKFTRKHPLLARFLPAVLHKPVGNGLLHTVCVGGSFFAEDTNFTEVIGVGLVAEEEVPGSVLIMLKYSRKQLDDPDGGVPFAVLMTAEEGRAVAAALLHLGVPEVHVRQLIQELGRCTFPKRPSIYRMAQRIHFRGRTAMELEQMVGDMSMGIMASTATGEAADA